MIIVTIIVMFVSCGLPLAAGCHLWHFKQSRARALSNNIFKWEESTRKWKNLLLFAQRIIVLVMSIDLVCLYVEEQQWSECSDRALTGRHRGRPLNFHVSWLIRSRCSTCCCCCSKLFEVVRKLFASCEFVHGASISVLSSHRSPSIESKNAPLCCTCTSSNNHFAVELVGTQFTLCRWTPLSGQRRRLSTSLATSDSLRIFHSHFSIRGSRSELANANSRERQLAPSLLLEAREWTSAILVAVGMAMVSLSLLQVLVWRSKQNERLRTFAKGHCDDPYLCAPR